MTKTTVEVFNCDRCKNVIHGKVHHVSVHVEIMTSRDGCYIDTQFSWKHLCAECRDFAAQYFSKAKELQVDKALAEYLADPEGHGR